MDTLLGWMDLLDEPVADETDLRPPVVERATTPDLDDLPLPEELRRLLEQRKQLEEQLKRLSGQGDSGTQDPREQARFPVRAHTKESRIEERRLRRHDEAQAALKRRAQERKNVAEAHELENERTRRDQERDALARRKAAERALAAQLEARAEKEQELIARRRAELLAALESADARLLGRQHASNEVRAASEYARRRCEALNRSKTRRTTAEDWEDARREVARLLASRLVVLKAKEDMAEESRATRRREHSAARLRSVKREAREAEQRMDERRALAQDRLARERASRRAEEAKWENERSRHGR